MATRRTLRPDPRLTKQLRNTVSICAEVMAAHEAAFTEAMTDFFIRRDLRQAIGELEGVVAGMQHRALQKKKAVG